MVTKFMPDLFKNQIFRKLWFSHLASIFGRRFTDIVIPWIILQHTGSPWKAGIVFVGEQLAPLLLAIPIGVLVESRSKKKTAIIAKTVQFSGMLFLLFLFLTGGLSVWTVFLTLLVTGAAGEFFAAAYTPFFVSAIGRNQLEEAYNLNEGADALGTLIGPSIGGGLLALFGGGWAFTVGALSILFSLMMISLVKIDKPVAAPTPGQENAEKKLRFYFKQGLEGIAYILKTKLQRLFVSLEGLLGFTALSTSLLIIILAEETLQLNAGQAGILYSAMGAGDIVGVLLLSRLHSIRWQILLSVSLFVSTIGALLLALGFTFWGALIGAFLLDGGLAIAFVVNSSNHMINTPDQLLARVDTATSTIDGFSRLGARAYAGGFAQIIGAQWTFAISGILLALGSLFVLSANKSNHKEEKGSDSYDYID